MATLTAPEIGSQWTHHYHGICTVIYTDRDHVKVEVKYNGLEPKYTLADFWREFQPKGSQDAFALRPADWLAIELESVANHWSQFGASKQDAQAIRDALRMVREGWECTVPQHRGVCTQGE